MSKRALLSLACLLACTVTPPSPPASPQSALAELPLAAEPGFDWSLHQREGFVRSPSGPEDRELDASFDLGSWTGWGLPEQAQAGSFTGPYDLRGSRWLGPSLLRFELQGLTPSSSSAQREPGLLRQRIAYGDLTVELRLFAVSGTRSVLLVDLRNGGPEAHVIAPRFEGESFGEAMLTAGGGNVVRAHRGGRHTPLAFRFPEGSTPQVAKTGYYTEAPELELHSGERRRIVVTIDAAYAAADPLPDPAAALERNRQRWAGYLKAHAPAPDDTALTMHAIETLVANWRLPDGPIKHEGLFPSWAYLGFHGFWAWDSWKHAVALARFDSRLAKQQVRVMLERQNDAGMVPDVVYPSPTERDNWRDTKPPLAAWAVEAIYLVDGDTKFVAEMLPRLERYHAWWYAERDHDRNGLCEYGSTDGTRIAAAWESGMDNAVRFDDAKMLQNGEQAWSMDRESVDLNAYLAVEKRILGRLHAALKNATAAERYAKQAEELGARINEAFWDDERGWYRDRRPDGEFAPGWGPEGWLPLWAGLASPEQAARVRDTMLDPKKFGTKVPLGTLAADDPAFDPTRGYWRGPVWLDQAYFGVAGLRRYGFEADADELTGRLLSNAEGLREGAAIRENYHPISGEGLNARHFSWSAASVLMLLGEYPAPQ